MGRLLNMVSLGRWCHIAETADKTAGIFNFIHLVKS